MKKSHTRGGFTIAELITVMAIVTILSAVAIPVVKFAVRRNQEIELNYELRRITNAIDQYHDLKVKGVIKKTGIVGETTYPNKLDDLVEPVELIDGRKLRLLNKRDLTDPITHREWRSMSSTDDTDSISTNGDDVFDIRSSSHELALDGRTRYDHW